MPMINPRVFLYSLAVLLALSGPAAAQNTPDISFHPAKSWFNSQNVVEGTTYCTLENEFNNGFILKFDGAGRGPGALNIDFRQDVFAAGKAYPVTLNVPGLIGKPLSATAPAKNTLRIHLLGQTALYESIRNAAVLDLTIEKNNFRFYMVGFADASQEFERCAGKVETAIAPPPAAPPAPAPAAETAPPVEDIENIMPAEVPVAPIPPAPQVTQSSPPVKTTKTVSKVEADFTAPPRPAPQTAPPADNKQADLLRKISELEALLHKAETENAALNQEVKSVLQEGVQEKASISSENWNLERATMRYQEAERQLKALGQRLKGAQAQCDMEKRELENMLFDPQVTTQEQMARLADLEQQLAEAREEMENQRRRYEERIRVLESQAGMQ